MERVISFHEDGSVEFTRNPELLSLFEGERKRIVRMTDILFDEEGQYYYIKFLTGPFKGFTLGGRRHPSHIGEAMDEAIAAMFLLHVKGDPPWKMNHSRQVILGEMEFPTYEDAVKCEIEFVDTLRKLGVRDLDK